MQCEVPCPSGCRSSLCEVDGVWLRLVGSFLICLHTFLIYLQALSWERYLTRSITCSLERLFRAEGELYQWRSIHRLWSLFITNLRRNLWWGDVLFIGVAKVASALASSSRHCPLSSDTKNNITSCSACMYWCSYWLEKVLFGFKKNSERT